MNNNLKWTFLRGKLKYLKKLAGCLPGQTWVNSIFIYPYCIICITVIRFYLQKIANFFVKKKKVKKFWIADLVSFLHIAKTYGEKKIYKEKNRPNCYRRSQ